MKNQINKFFRLFFLYSRFTLKTTLQARAGIVLFLAGKLFRFLFLFLFIFILFGKTKVIQGYSLNQALIFYLTFNVVDSLTQILFREVYRFRPLVVSGTFDMVLLKPMHPFTKILFGGIDFMDIIFVIPYFFLVIFFFIKTVVFPHSLFLIPYSIFIYIIFILNSLILACAFHIVVLALGILTTEVDHTIMIYRDVMGIGKFPMEIYKEPIRSFFTFAVPVGIMMSFPTKALFGLLSGPFIWYACGISLGGLLFSLLLWNFALRRYQSWGG